MQEVAPFAGTHNLPEATGFKFMISPDPPEEPPTVPRVLHIPKLLINVGGVQNLGSRLLKPPLLIPNLGP